MDSLIFIGGTPRSGTSLVQRILDMHEEIYAGPEFDHLSALCKLYRTMKHGLENQRQSNYYDGDQLKATFANVICDIFQRKMEREAVTRLSEKTPSNVLAFEELHELFPKAKFVFVVRDPRGSISSFKNVAKRAKEYGDSVLVGNNLFKDLALIKEYVSSGNEFCLKHQEYCYLLRYESLVKDPKREVSNLCAFLGVPFYEGMLDLSAKENDMNKLINARNKTVRAWFTKGMLERKIDEKDTELWRSELSWQEIGIINEFFRNNRLECLDPYDFNGVGGLALQAVMFPRKVKKRIKSIVRLSLKLINKSYLSSR